MSKTIKAMMLAAAVGLSAGAMQAIVEPAAAVEAAQAQTVSGAHVNIEAQWNESKSHTGVYQAPAGFVIKSAVPVVKSATRESYHVVVSADRREARLVVSVRGKGEFWNKERGWFDGHLAIELEAAR